MGARETALHSGQPSGGRSSGHLTLVQRVNPEETLSHEFLRQHQKFPGPSRPSFTSLPKAHGGRGRFRFSGRGPGPKAALVCTVRGPSTQQQEGDLCECRCCETAVFSLSAQALKPELFGSLEGRGIPGTWCPRGKPIQGDSGGPEAGPT